MIVGGGIGGLFAANALIAHGVDVSVYEQAPALGEVGAGIYLTPNSVRHLERVGLGSAVEKWGARVGPKSHYFRHDGSPIAPVQVTDASGWNANFGMHRADLVDFLAAALPAGVVRCGHRAIGFEQVGDVARVRFANGASAEETGRQDLRPDGWPQATTVGYANDGLTLYFLCGPDSQKAANLARDDRVSITIDHDTPQVMDITGLSMAARAQAVADLAEGEKALRLLMAKYPEQAGPPLRLRLMMAASNT